jgi:hypothetical protein
VYLLVTECHRKFHLHLLSMCLFCCSFQSLADRTLLQIVTARLLRLSPNRVVTTFHHLSIGTKWALKDEGTSFQLFSSSRAKSRSRGYRLLLASLRTSAEGYICFNGKNGLVGGSVVHPEVFQGSEVSISILTVACLLFDDDWDPLSTCFRGCGVTRRSGSIWSK